MKREILIRVVLVPGGILVLGLIGYAIWTVLIEKHLAAREICNADPTCLTAVFNGHRRVSLIGWSADGEQLLTRGRAGALVHAASDGSRLTRLNPGRDGYRFRISADRSSIISSNNTQLRLFDWQGAELQQWQADEELRIRAAVGVPLFKGYAVADARGVALHHGDGRPITRLLDDGAVLQLASSADGSHVAAYDFMIDTLYIWPLQNLSASVTIPDIELSSISFSADGSLLIAHGTGGLWVWRSAGAELITGFETDDIKVTASTLSDDASRFAVGFENGTVLIYRLQDRELLKRLENQRSPSALAFSPQGDRLAIALRTEVTFSGGERVAPSLLGGRDSSGEIRPGSVLRQSSHRRYVRSGFVLIWAVKE